MNEPDETGASHSSKAPSETDASGASFSLGRVLLVVVPLALLVGAAFAFLAFDGMSQLAGLTRPPLVPATGKIVFQGEPLGDATLMTQPVDRNLPGAMGFVDEEGKFVLKTDINGTYVDGAYAGEHQVVVTKRHMEGLPSGPMQPPLYTPEQYASFKTSPLTITVARDAKQNQFTLELEGQPQPLPDFGGRGPQGGGKKRREDPRSLVSRFDADEDGSLSRDELARAPRPLQGPLHDRDTNGDGTLDSDEIDAWAAEAAEE